MLFSLGHHHFSAVRHAGTTKVGKGTSRLGRQNPDTLYTIQQRFPTSAELVQHAARDNGCLCHLCNLIDWKPSQNLTIAAAHTGHVGEKDQSVSSAGNST